MSFWFWAAKLRLSKENTKENLIFFLLFVEQGQIRPKGKDNTKENFTISLAWRTGKSSRRCRFAPCFEYSPTPIRFLPEGLPFFAERPLRKILKAFPQNLKGLSANFMSQSSCCIHENDKQKKEIFAK
ncbi:MAG: hypothetical protein K6F20_09785 [Bacteroidaceae bacterium]|nr:hypothetical protein [Bacteroidaceae bacterium]